MNVERVPIAMDQRRNAHSTEEALLLRYVLDIEHVHDRLISEMQKLPRHRQQGFSPHFGETLIHRPLITKHTNRKLDVESDPLVTLIILQKRATSEAMPASCLTPNGNARHVFHAF